jgi:hypothetical protein
VAGLALQVADLELEPQALELQEPQALALQEQEAHWALGLEVLSWALAQQEHWALEVLLWALCSSLRVPFCRTQKMRATQLQSPTRWCAAAVARHKEHAEQAVNDVPVAAPPPPPRTPKGCSPPTQTSQHVTAACCLSF